MGVVGWHGYAVGCGMGYDVGCGMGYDVGCGMGYDVEGQPRGMVSCGLMT